MNFETKGSTTAYDTPSATAGYSSQAGSQKSPLMMASDTFDRTVELTRQITNLAERLCGPAIEKSVDPSGPSRAGIFGAVEATTRNVDVEIGRAFAALNRIEAELP